MQQDMEESKNKGRQNKKKRAAPDKVVGAMLFSE